jgi:hypothetical protein
MAAALVLLHLHQVPVNGLSKRSDTVVVRVQSPRSGTGVGMHGGAVSAGVVAGVEDGVGSVEW